MVKGIYQVFTLGIRFRIWISVCSRADMKDWKLSGWNMKRFHKRRQVVVTNNIKALSLSLDQSLCLALPVFLSHAALHKRLCEISLLWMAISALKYWPAEMEGKCFIFKSAEKSRNVKCRRWLTFIVTGLCSDQLYKCRCVDCNKELTFSLRTFYLLTSYFILRLKHLFVLLCSQ